MNYETTVGNTWLRWVEAIRNDPDLRKVLGAPDRLRAALGERFAFDEPTTAQMPCIRLTPSPGPSDWHTNTGTAKAHSFPINVQVEIWVKGSDVRASMEVWEAFLLAVFPQDSTKRSSQLTLWYELGISGVRVIQAAWGAQPFAEGLYGTGSIQLMQVLNT